MKFSSTASQEKPGLDTVSDGTRTVPILSELVSEILDPTVDLYVRGFKVVQHERHKIMQHAHTDAIIRAV